MAHIQHRRYRGRPRPAGIRRMPPVGAGFLVLAGFVAVAELWPVVDALMIGVTEWWSRIPDVLAPAARAAALVGMPAAVAWASPRAPSRNRWLWIGAVLLSLVQLARYPAQVAQGALLTAEGGDARYLASLALSMTLAMVTILGTWALSEGLKDAGGRVGRPALALLAVGVAAVVLVWLGPAFVAGLPAGLDLASALVSVVTNSLFLLAHAVLAARAVAGVRRGAGPRTPWRVGAVSAVALFAILLLSVGVVVAGQLVVLDDAGMTILGRSLTVLVFFGWPLFGIAVAAGMGRLPPAGLAERLGGRPWLMGARPRFVPASAGQGS